MATDSRPSLRPFRFGVGGTQLATNLSKWGDNARRIEDLGYSVLTVGDHPSMRAPGALAALAGAALATTTLRVGTYVLANDFRHPVQLAREIATLDQLCGGHVELGIGAGWLETDHAVYGIEFDAASTRIARLEEALQIIILHFAAESFSFQGRFYCIEGADAFPAPLQRPRPPLVVGGGGRSILTVAARYADVVALTHSFRTGSDYLRQPTLETSTWDATLAKVEVVRQAAGDRFNEIELGALVQQVVIDSDVQAAAARVAASVRATPIEVLNSPAYLIGDASQLIDQLLEQREATGLSYITVTSNDSETFAPVVKALTGV